MTVPTCIIQYFRRSVKVIVQIFYGQAISIGHCAYFTVVVIVRIACQRGAADLHRLGVAKGIVGEIVYRGLGGDGQKTPRPTGPP